jgi:hypothetical protein
MPVDTTAIDEFVRTKGSLAQTALSRIRGARWTGNTICETMDFSHAQDLIRVAMDLVRDLKNAGLINSDLNIWKDPDNHRPEADKALLEALGVDLNRERRP